MYSETKDCHKKDQCKRNERRILKVDEWFIKRRLFLLPMCDQLRKAYFDEDQLALEELRTLFEHAHCLCCGYTLLHLAVNVASKELFDYCLSRNFDVEATNDNEETTLHLAAAFLDDPWFVEQLLDNKAKVNAIDGLGCTPLQICLSNDKPSSIILKKLLDHGAKPNKLFSLDNNEPIDEEQLLDKMIKANSRNSSGVLPLYEAVYNGDHVAARKLLEDGACPNSLNCYRRSLLQVACYNNSFGCAKALLEAGVDVNESDLEGRTALHYAIIVESEEIVELLLQYHCDLWIRDSDGFTALEMAAFTNRWKMTERLLLSRDGIKKCTEMLLMEALERRCTEVAISIIRRGYFRVHDTEFGRQLMDCAVITGQRKVARLLRSVGVGLKCKRSSNVGEDVSVRPSKKATTRVKSVNKVTFSDIVEFRSMESDGIGQMRKRPYVPRQRAEKSSTRNRKQTLETRQKNSIGFGEQPSRKRTFPSSKKSTEQGELPKCDKSASSSNFVKRSLPTTDSALAPKVQSFFKSLCKEPASHRSKDDSLFKFYCEKQLVYDEIFDKTLCNNEIRGEVTSNVDMFFKFYKDCVN